MSPSHAGDGAGHNRPPAAPDAAPRTILDKIWQAHRLGADDQLEVDRVFLHERQLGMVERLGQQGVTINSSRLVACLDQQMPTQERSTGAGFSDGPASAQVMATLEQLEATSDRFGVPVFGPGDPRSGVLNVVGPEQGMTVPGALVVGADDHMSTHGAFGAVALTLLDSELAEVFELGAIRRERPELLRVTVSGRLGPLVGAKDLALWLLGRVGPGAARGSVLELGGPTVRGLGMDGRMTLCNLAVEIGALSAIIEPDERTFDYLAGRPFAPSGREWPAALERWHQLRSDPHARVDGELVVHVGDLGPQATWGSHAWQVVPLDGVVPVPDQRDAARRDADERALHEQDLVPGTSVADIAVDQVFIGSCANARIDDIRAAAEVVRGHRVQVPTWVVPGSHPVARQAEAEGLHHVLRDAGIEWRTPGCSLCIGSNGDAVGPGTRLASTANRPQRGRVGPGARVHVLGPAAAAATALTGRLTDPRTLT
ncbi:MAG: 3-isopropylmalate dehydratase large subunit [Acidimicrobiia bacterium]|nr:3-isopropylmalate dehydratase large subunit [Acidimicrobiia bacterium]